MSSRTVQIPRTVMIPIVVTNFPDVVSTTYIEQRSQVSMRDEVLDICWDIEYERVVVIGTKDVAVLESADSISLTIQDVLMALGYMEAVELTWIQDAYAGLALLKNLVSVIRVSEPIVSQFAVKNSV